MKDVIVHHIDAFLNVLNMGNSAGVIENDDLYAEE